ncbi:MAG: GerW family sporulation protein [Lachnospirales bacterium]
MSSINNSIDILFSKMENFVSSKTVVGEPITYGEIIVVPLINVSFGVGATSSDSREDKNGKSVGVGGIGAKITPSAVLVINKGNVQMVSASDTNSVNKLIDMVPGIVSKFNFFSKDEEDTDIVETEE